VSDLLLGHAQEPFDFAPLDCARGRQGKRLGME
jgi:hypothetical protein